MAGTVAVDVAMKPCGQHSRCDAPLLLLLFFSILRGMCAEYATFRCSSALCKAHHTHQAPVAESTLQLTAVSLRDAALLQIIPMQFVPVASNASRPSSCRHIYQGGLSGSCAPGPTLLSPFGCSWAYNECADQRQRSSSTRWKLQCCSSTGGSEGDAWNLVGCAT